MSPAMAEGTLKVISGNKEGREEGALGYTWLWEPCGCSEEGAPEPKPPTVGGLEVSLMTPNMTTS